MRIGVDGYNLAMPHGTGVATYGYTLARTLATLGHSVDGLFGIDIGRDPQVSELTFFDRLTHPRPERGRWRRRITAARGLRTVAAHEVVRSGTIDVAGFADRVPPFQRIWTSPALFARAQRLFAATGRFTTVSIPFPPDVMHWTYPVPIRVAGARNVYTLHDLVPLTLPGATLSDKARYRRLVEGCVARADAIATVSTASRGEIVRLLGADPALVVCTGQVSPMRFEDATAPAPAGARQFGLEERGYFLFFGAVEPKKNVGRLLEAYLALDTDTPLVMVAGRGWRNEDALYLLPRGDANDPRRRALERRVIRMDYLPRRLLAPLIASARAVLLPSLSEGFGLPAHEAMLLGTPVLASTAGALPEVVGDGGLLVDPYDVSAIGAGIAALDRDPALRDRLAVAGRRHAERYSIDRFGRALASLYDVALAGAPRRGAAPRPEPR